MGLYRLQQHVRKSVPQLAAKKVCFLTPFPLSSFQSLSLPLKSIRLRSRRPSQPPHFLPPPSCRRPVCSHSPLSPFTRSLALTRPLLPPYLSLTPFHLSLRARWSSGSRLKLQTASSTMQSMPWSKPFHRAAAARLCAAHVLPLTPNPDSSPDAAPSKPCTTLKPSRSFRFVSATTAVVFAPAAVRWLARHRPLTWTRPD